MSQAVEQAPTSNRRGVDLMTTAEVAALTRAPLSTVRYWRHLGAGPRSFRLGRRVVYERRDVEQWIASQRAAQTSTAVG